MLTKSRRRHATPEGRVPCRLKSGIVRLMASGRIGGAGLAGRGGPGSLLLPRDGGVCEVSIWAVCSVLIGLQHL